MYPIIEETIINQLQTANEPLSFTDITIAVKGNKELKHYQSVLRACKNLEKRGKIKVWQLWSYTENKKTNFAELVIPNYVAVFNHNTKKYYYVEDNRVDADCTRLSDMPNIELKNIQDCRKLLNDRDSEIVNLKYELRKAVKNIELLKGQFELNKENLKNLNAQHENEIRLKQSSVDKALEAKAYYQRLSGRLERELKTATDMLAGLGYKIEPMKDVSLTRIE